MPAEAFGRVAGVGLLLALAAGSGAIGGYALARRQLVAELERRPPVAVLDVRRVQAAAGAEPTRADHAVQAVRAAARRLAAAGYVVLDSQAILAAPEDVYVPVE